MHGGGGNTGPAEKQTGYYRVLGYRWVTLIFLFLLIFLNGVNMSFYAPIVVNMSFAYGVSIAMMQVFFVIVLLLYPITSFTIFKFVAEAHGPFACIIAGTICVMTGSFMRCMLNSSFYPFMIIGFVFTGMSQPFLNNLAAITSINWFPAKERPLATMLASLGNTIGSTIGSVLPDLFLGGSYPFHFKVYRANIIELFPYVIMSFFCITFYREKPPFAPAYNIYLEQE